MCPAGGGVIARHSRVVKWGAEKLKEYRGCQAKVEQPVQPPLVTRVGRMDILANDLGKDLLVDVVICTSATDSQRERERRVNEPGRSLRTAEARKLAAYGPNVLALAVEDTGRLGSGAKRFIKDLAERQDVRSVADEYQRLQAELQHVVLSSTASMLQRCRGVVPAV